MIGKIYPAGPYAAAQRKPSVIIASLDKKPEKNGNPAKAAAQIEKQINVIGNAFLKPPIVRISCGSNVSSFSEGVTAWITEPAERNNPALKNACVAK